MALGRNRPDSDKQSLFRRTGKDYHNMSSTNAAFVSDEGCNNSFQSGEELSKNVYEYELSEKGLDKGLENYEPYEHRKVAHPTTNAETLLHLLKGSLGTGILAMPLAFYNAGYILGLVGTLFIGTICTYCIHMLIKAEYELCKLRKVPSLTYPGTIKEAFSEGPRLFQKFAPYSGHMVNTFLLVYQLGTCCVYIVFIATNIQDVVELYIDELWIGIYMLMFLIPLIFMNWIRNLKLLAPFSTLANLITLASFGVILYYLFTGNPTFEGREPIGEIGNIPLFFGTVLFALEAIGVIMPLENEMKTPRAFGGSCGVLNIAMICIITLYVGMGLLGYLTYGKDVEATITINLGDEALAQVVKCMLAFAIFITYGLQCYVAVDITWNEYLSSKFEKNKYKNVIEYGVRTVIVLITFLLAIAIPELELFISLFGALCLSALGIAIPAMIDGCLHYRVYKGTKYYLMLTKNIALVVFGVFGLVIGTYTSLEKIIETFIDD